MNYKPPVVTLRPKQAAAALDISVATLWNRINENKLAYFRDDGVTSIVYDWPGGVPPREGRAPSICEYVEERIADAANAERRIVAGAVHRGRPRKYPDRDE
jgi:hypothetical protein